MMDQIISRDHQEESEWSLVEDDIISSLQGAVGAHAARCVCSRCCVAAGKDLEKPEE